MRSVSGRRSKRHVPWHIVSQSPVLPERVFRPQEHLHHHYTTFAPSSILACPLPDVVVYGLSRLPSQSPLLSGDSDRRDTKPLDENLRHNL